MASQGVVTMPLPLRFKRARCRAAPGRMSLACRYVAAADVQLRGRSDLIGAAELVGHAGRAARLVPDSRAAVAQQDRGAAIGGGHAAGRHIDRAGLSGDVAEVEGIPTVAAGDGAAADVEDARSCRR